MQERHRVAHRDRTVLGMDQDEAHQCPTLVDQAAPRPKRLELSPVDTAIWTVLLLEPVVGFLEVAIAQEPAVRAQRRRVLRLPPPPF